jgi:tetratricopeptide (TPR) repeat protein
MMRLLWSSLTLAALLAAFFAALPLAVWYHSGRARQMLQRRDNQAAVQELRTALRFAPDEPELHLLLARAHRRLGNLARVEPLLRRAERLGGDPVAAERERWLTRAQAGRLRDAEPHLTELLADPRDDGVDICEAYVQGYFINLRTREALQLLDAWKRDYPEDAQAYFMEGYLRQALAQTREAIAAYRKGLELRPERTIMRCRLAELLAEEHEVERAAAHFRRCLREAPGRVEILTAWAKSLAAAGELDQARTALEKVLDHTPGHFEALRQLGELEVTAGNFEQALPHLNAALEQRPYDTTTHNALGKALRALGRADQAQPHLDYVAEAEQSLARMERLLPKVVEQPGNAELRFEIGMTLLQYGDPDDGAKWLRTVLELQPDHAAARQALAAYYESRGDWQQAAVYRQQEAQP